MKILIADDHASIFEPFKFFFETAFKNEKHSFTTVINCEEAVNEIERKKLKNSTFDFAVIDISMPGYAEKDIHNGSDLCKYLNQEMPNCKTFINTAILENFTLFDLVQNLKPDGIAIKSDMKAEDYIAAFQKIWKGEIFRSPSLNTKVNEIWNYEALANETNRTIITCLANGYRIKEIANELQLTEVSINKRISKIKKALEINETSILREVKRRGYV